jgi:hypothetical protein
MFQRVQLGFVLLRGAPALLLTLACAGVVQAQPIMPIAAPCTLPTNRTYRIVNGTNLTIAGGAADTSFPFIKSFPATSTWSVSPASTMQCDAGPVCVGLSVATLTGTANRTEYFSGIAVTGTQRLNVTAGACTAEFTFKADTTGGGWGEPDVGGQGGGTSTAGAGAGGTSTAGAGAGGTSTAGAGAGGTSTAGAGAGGEGMAIGAGGDGMTASAGRNGGGTAGVGGAAAGGALSSDAAGQHATDVAGDTGANDAGAPGDASAADTSGCDCAVLAGKSGGMQAWFVLGVSIAFAARRLRRSAIEKG